MDLIRKIPAWLGKRRYGFSEAVSQGRNGYGPESRDVTEVDDYEQANLISSKVDAGEFHLPVLDLDFDVHLEPSTTPGHFHLYLNKAVAWHKYVTLLVAMEYAGLLEPGFVELSVERGATYVRKPGIKKISKRLYRP